MRRHPMKTKQRGKTFLVTLVVITSFFLADHSYSQGKSRGSVGDLTPSVTVDTSRENILVSSAELNSYPILGSEFANNFSGHATAYGTYWIPTGAPGHVSIADLWSPAVRIPEDSEITGFMVHVTFGSGTCNDELENFRIKFQCLDTNPRTYHFSETRTLGEATLSRASPQGVATNARYISYHLSSPHPYDESNEFCYLTMRTTVAPSCSPRYLDYAKIYFRPVSP